MFHSVVFIYERVQKLVDTIVKQKMRMQEKENVQWIRLI